MKNACVEISSSYGSFTKVDSNAGGFLTHKYPPKTAITGMVGAILGFDFEKTVEYLMGDISIAIEPKNIPDIVMHTFYNHHRRDKDRPANVSQEILVDPTYRIFLNFDDVSDKKIVDKKKLNIGNGMTDIYTAFKKTISENRSYYPLYMGRNNFPLEYNQQNIQLKEVKEDKKVQCDCVVPYEAVKEELGSAYQVESEIGLSSQNMNMNYKVFKNIPINETKNRKYTETIDYLFKNNVDYTQLIKPMRIDDDYKLFGYSEDGEDKVIILF